MADIGHSEKNEKGCSVPLEASQIVRRSWLGPGLSNTTVLVLGSAFETYYVHHDRARWIIAVRRGRVLLPRKRGRSCNRYCKGMMLNDVFRGSVGVKSARPGLIRRLDLDETRSSCL